MNLKEIKDLIQIMNEHHLVEVEIEREGLKVRLVKGGQSRNFPSVIETAIVASPEKTSTAAEKESAAAQLSSNIVTIKAPMVGTFYLTPSPDAAPFVEEGSMIEEGQVICIIEAMKLMNEIKAEVKGKIQKILAENGQPIEFSQPLFLVEKAS